MACHTSTTTFHSSTEMAEIQVNVRGRINSGRWTGQYLTVEDDTEQSGGYLIVIEADESGKNGGDLWIEKDKLNRAFEEAGWEVEWSTTVDVVTRTALDFQASVWTTVWARLELAFEACARRAQELNSRVTMRWWRTGNDAFPFHATAWVPR